MNWDLIRTGEIKLKHVDQISVRTKSSLGWIIRFFTRNLNEEKTFSNHDTGISSIIKSEWGYRYNIIEAVKGGVKENWLQSLNNSNHAVVIARYMRLSELIAGNIITEIRRSLGKIYSKVKIVFHGIDSVLSKLTFQDISIFSRMHFKASEICTTVWTIPLGKRGIKFGIWPKACNPDIKLDYILKHPLQWKIVFMCDKAERFLIETGQYPDSRNFLRNNYIYLNYKGLTKTKTYKNLVYKRNLNKIKGGMV